MKFRWCLVVIAFLTVASARREKKKTYIPLSLVYGVPRDFLRQRESKRPYSPSIVRKS